ncbi:MAG: diaminopimelate decarboxylase [Sphingomonadaceae bacterium]
MDHFNYIDGVLHAEDVPLPAIAEAVGTPFYCYSTATLQRHARVFRDAVAGTPDPLVAFAVKANPNIAVLAVLAREGLGADVVSGGELHRALMAGIPPSRIVFSGVGKTDDELIAALDAGIYQINVEGEPELDRLSEIATRRGQQAPVALRANPDVDAGTIAKISTGKAENKFGIPWDRIPGLYARATALPGIRPVGIAAHIGSQLRDLAPLETAWTRLGELAGDLRANGLPVSRIDLGGGLGIPYDPDLPAPPPPSAYGALAERVIAGWPDGGRGMSVIFEPGRLIAGNAGILVSTVITIKDGGQRRFVVLDAAMNDLIRPTLYEAWHDILAVAPRPGRETVTVVGPVCETGDQFAEDRGVTPMQAGDLVALMTAGAYGATMASTYNSRSLIPEVLVDGGRFAIVRERQTIDMMLKQEHLPPWMESKA